MGQLGINTVHLDMEAIEEMGLDRVEFVLARGLEYAEMLDDILSGIDQAKRRGLSYSIHLPIFLFDWYPEDYLSAYYLDPDHDKRELAFRFLEANLSRLEGCGAEYLILHFPGVYRYVQEPHDFETNLDEALDRMEELADRYGLRLLLEYFGSNFSFWRVEDWIDRIRPYEHLGMLCDTGHLYFSSVLHGFDFYEALEELGAHSDAFHLWTTRGEGAYSDSESYRQFHHIVLHVGQNEKDGFAFDTAKTLDIIRRFDRPTIIEASERYRGREYFMSGIRSVVEYLK